MAGMGALEEVGDMQGRVLRFEAKITLSKSKGLGAAHPQWLGGLSRKSRGVGFRVYWQS